MSIGGTAATRVIEVNDLSRLVDRVKRDFKIVLDKQGQHQA